ncbi:hypothetical protein AFL01nite_29510 [Aeromicrobium flavum]|uniref:Peptidase S55 domain-containing protein n=1 Tax=Aeromicrobium flavum TaxID=416568 RepID=A0A512HYW5_9ACTN|nr:hypothetical protein [Aeromicrobium flavum]GEO90624.1 hypothetical protein AFL01nite_29510 [Aeromicrobium flavum]
MHRSTLRWLASAAIAGVAATALAAPTAQAAPDTSFCTDGSQPMVPQSEAVDTFDESTAVTGLTVVKGTTPTEFTGRYTGYLENALGQGVDMLLFTLSGAGIDSGETPAGIWAGMSGSPVYTEDGRLIGAVAYGLSPDNIPVAGVTPADYMKRVGSDRLASPAKVTITKANLEGASRKAESRLVGQSPQRLKTVKVAAGRKDLANRTLARMPRVSASTRAVRAGGFAQVATPSAIPEPLVPGGNIAVGYTTGDLFTGGIGTVTAICGSTVWAFGHPMDFQGETSLSMHNASTALVVPDTTGWSGSYKQVSRIGQQVGTITVDGYAAIRGQLGLIRGFPVVTSVRNASGDLITSYRGTVVDPYMAAYGPSYGAAFAVQDVLDNLGIGTARLSWKIDYRLRSGRTGSLTNSQVYASVGMLADQAATDIGNDVSAIAYTDLADASITRVTSTLTLLGNQAVEYRPAGVQRWNGKAWVKLRGAIVKPHRTLKVRPVYRQYVNDRPRATSTGPVQSFRIGKNAKGRASITLTSLADGPECFEDEDGEMVCPEFEEEAATSFSALLGKLDALIRADRVKATATYAWKVGKQKGVSERRASVKAPGKVTGSHTTTFRVRR